VSVIQVKANANADDKPDWLEMVRRQAGPLRYGVVQMLLRQTDN
jgi:hypothetical protein